MRIGRDMYAHADASPSCASGSTAIIDAEGSVTLARLRDELRTSRKFAQALLEHLDAARVTRRRPDDSRVLRRSPRARLVARAWEREATPSAGAGRGDVVPPPPP